MHVGQEIKRLREKKGWSQDELVKALERIGYSCTPGTISNVESGRRDAYIPLLKHCEHVFEVRPGALLQYSALDHAQDWCQRSGLYLKDYLRLVLHAYRLRSSSGCTGGLPLLPVPPAPGMAFAS